MLYSNLSVSADGNLIFAGHDTTKLVQEYGTPLMLMDEALVRARCREYIKAMSDYLPAGSRPLYASKALSFKRMYEIMREEGMGVDVVSSGELHTAVRAGFPMENAYFHGNSKTDRDIRYAIENGIGCFVCDNIDELNVIDTEAAAHGITQKVLLRLTPGIDPHTHEKINTGRIDCKFGAAIETGQAEELLVIALGKANIDVIGYHCHIGSQIFDHIPFNDAAVLMLQFMAEMKAKHGYSAKVLNLGGGMGVPYTKKDRTINYSETIRNIGKLISEYCAVLGLDEPAILMEPGRSIVGDAGITVYTVSGTKKIPGFKNYVAIDGGMSDNPRYTLYEAEYTILAADRMHDAPEGDWIVAGCCCESGDLIQEDVPLPELKRGDLLAVLTTGAYNYSMASNYNRVPRPPVVMLTENGSYIGVRRETLDDMLLCDM
ncbi:MAG: diaminopimelate decarboxylase [Oscillospiraceae bacterium]|nr:diaminopimelate decarboxylase [Oscillospiraceae bacterium]